MLHALLASPSARLCAGLSLVLGVAACGGGDALPDAPSDPQAAAAAAVAEAAGPAPLPDAVAAEDVAALGAAADPRRREAQAVTATTTITATCGITDFQVAALARINQHRARGASCRTAGTFGPAAPLAWNGRLIQAATGHAQDMAARNYFSHTSLDGRTFVDRVNATGYLWSALGENIAAGYTTVNAVVDGWMASDGHCRNLMNPNFREIGMACAASATSRYGRYWTLDLGRPR